VNTNKSVTYIDKMTTDHRVINRSSIFSDKLNPRHRTLISWGWKK